MCCPANFFFFFLSRQDSTVVTPDSDWFSDPPYSKTAHFRATSVHLTVNKHSVCSFCHHTILILSKPIPWIFQILWPIRRCSDDLCYLLRLCYCAQIHSEKCYLQIVLPASYSYGLRRILMSIPTPTLNLPVQTYPYHKRTLKTIQIYYW